MIAVDAFVFCDVPKCTAVEVVVFKAYGPQNRQVMNFNLWSEITREPRMTGWTVSSDFGCRCPEHSAEYFADTVRSIAR